MISTDFPWAKIYHLGNPLRINELGDLLDEIWAHHSHRRRDRALDESTPRLIGETPRLRDIKDSIERVANSLTSILITGEPGTGKEAAARRIHSQSGRIGEFVAVNCGAIPDKLLESELYGYVRGAFTDTSSRHVGQFERAQDGTIFLDEIGDMTANMQIRLLRVLEERVIEPVGSERPIAIDVRVIAATQHDLPRQIAAGSFREDLYRRLNACPLPLPPLRERKEDIPLLINELIRRLRADQQVSITLDDAAIACLVEYDWPGNVRELANLIERLSVIKSYGTIGVADLPRSLRGTTADGGAIGVDAELANTTLKQHLGDIESRLIRDALEQSGGVVTRAANLLGVGRTTLFEKMRRYKIAARSDSNAT